MKRINRIAILAIISTFFVGMLFFSVGENKAFGALAAASAGELIETARLQLDQGDKDAAIATLDAAFQIANSTGDCDSLMTIGDLYVRIDPTLQEKAMQAWTSAGKWKCQP